MKPIDFQGIAHFDQALVERLQAYFIESESLLAKCIIHSIHPLPGKSNFLFITQFEKAPLRLRDAVQSFGKSIATIATSEKSIVPSNDWEITTKQVNQAIWGHVEVLEGCVTELFQQLNQAGFEHWHQDLIAVIDQLKSVLLRQMKECEWLMNRMESLLWDYRRVCQEKSGKVSFWKTLFSFGSSLIDRSLFSFLKKSSRYLKIQSKWFSKQYADYHKLKEKIEESIRKFKGYHVFSELENTFQSDFKQLYFLLKLWSLNSKSKSIPIQEPIRAIRSAFSLEKAAQLFNGYYCALEKSLYEKSWSIKKNSCNPCSDPSGFQLISQVLKGVRAEVHTLGATIEAFREFDLRTHPNPYIRNRWGFAEWIVGPEPEKTRSLLNLVFEIEFLDKLFEKFAESVKTGPSKEVASEFDIRCQEINRILHEMGQPLSSRIVMRSRAENLLDLLEELDELGSFQIDAVSKTGKILSKAMRADWQFHSLFEFTSFHQLYRVHQGIVGPLDDRKHFGRMNKFKKVIEELKEWVKQCNTHRHVHEIEADMNDMRGYLQDFLASIQFLAGQKNLEKDQALEQTSDYAKQLLEYRYLFGSFFYMLHQHGPEGKLIRNQFLFVDQYFEAVESLLYEVRQKRGSNTT